MTFFKSYVKIKVQKLEDFSAMKRVVLAVEGMHCDICELHVNDIVRRAARVNRVKSSRLKDRTEVICEDFVDEAVLKSAIEEQGYIVLDVRSEPYAERGIRRSRFKSGRVLTHS